MSEGEIIRKKIIRIGDREMLTEVRILWPTEKTLRETLIDQLESSIVEELVIQFDVEPVLDEAGREVDRVATGAADVRLRVVAWGAMDLRRREEP